MHETARENLSAVWAEPIVRRGSSAARAEHLHFAFSCVGREPRFLARFKSVDAETPGNGTSLLRLGRHRSWNAGSFNSCLQLDGTEATRLHLVNLQDTA
jgi:hypothetical protein